MCFRPVVIKNPEYIRTAEKYSDYYLGSKHFKALSILDSPNCFYSSSVQIPFPKSLDPDYIDDYFAVTPDGLVMPLYILVDCGKCVDCRNRYAKDLGARMILEQACHECSPFFVTLTYNDENLPINGVDRGDVRKFVRALHDRLRHGGYPHEFRHVFFSEYGSKHGRPHYHGIIFGLDPREFKDYLPLSDVIAQVWNKGFVDVQLVKTPSCFKYVSKYVLKQSTCGIPEGKNDNFWLSSRRHGGLGANILHLFDVDRLKLEFPFITVKCLDNTYKVFIPKSVRRKLCPSFSEYIGQDLIKKFKRFTFLSSLLIQLVNRDSNFSTLIHPLCPSISLIRDRHRSLVNKFKYLSPRYRFLGYCSDDIIDYTRLNTEFDINVYLNEYEYLFGYLFRFEFDEKKFLEFLTTKKVFSDLMHSFMVNLLNTIEVYDKSSENYFDFINKRMFGSRIKDLQ